MPSSARPSQVNSFALLHDDQIVVRVQRQRPLLVIDRLVMVVMCQMDRGQDPVDVADVVVERMGGLQFRHDSLPGRLAIGAVPVDPGLAQRTGRPGMGMGISGIELDGALQHDHRGRIVLLGRSMVEQLSRQHAFIGDHVFRRLAGGALAGRRFHAPEQGRDDR